MQPIILICDDEEAVRGLIRVALSREGYEIYEASDSDELLSCARSLQPDVIVLDMTMPGGSGLDALAVLRRDPGLRQARVILATAGAGAAEQSAAEAVGVDRFLTKPFTMDQLRATVRELAGDAVPTACTPPRPRRGSVLDEEPGGAQSPTEEGTNRVASQLDREEILSEVAHTFRTPLAVISGYVELLTVRDDPKLRADALSRIEEAAGRLSHAIDRLVVTLESDEGHLVERFLDPDGVGSQMRPPLGPHPLP